MSGGRGLKRGGALIVTVLVSIAMTGLAIVAVSAVTVESQLAQNHKMLKQAQYVAETGMVVTMQRVQTMGSAALLRERQRLMTENPSERISMNMQLFGDNAVFTRDEDPQRNSLGPNSADIDFVVEVDSLRTAPPPPGYQINGDGAPTGLEVGLLAEGKVGQLHGGVNENNVGYSTQRLWALVPVP